MYCYLQNIDKNQDIIDPYEFSESNENNDDIAINNNHESYNSSFYIPYLEQLDFAPPEDKLNTVTERTKDDYQLQVPSCREQTIQYKAISEYHSSERRYGNYSGNENSQISDNHQIASNFPPTDTTISSNSKIRILDYQIFPASSLTKQFNNMDVTDRGTSESRIDKTVSRPCTVDENSNDKYLDSDYIPESDKSYCTNSTSSVSENISVNEDIISCSEEDFPSNKGEQVSIFLVH